MQVDYHVKHYGILEDEHLVTYLVIQSLVIVNVCIMILDAFLTMSNNCNAGTFDAMVFVEGITDLLCGGGVLVYIVMQFPAQIRSANTVRGVLGRLDAIPWESASVDLADKKSSFFEYVQDLLDHIGWSEQLNNICNIIMLVNLLRVIMCTNVHPRLALLTGTVANAMVCMYEWQERPARMTKEICIYGKRDLLVCFSRVCSNTMECLSLSLSLCVCVCARAPSCLCVCVHALARSSVLQDDLWHTAILTCLLLVCFAGIGTWRFGRYKFVISKGRVFCHGDHRAEDRSYSTLCIE